MSLSLTKKTLSEAAVKLANRDKDLSRIFEANGVPPLWARVPGFSTLIRIILEQQVSLASASSMYHRISANVVPFTPERFLALGTSYLRSLGVTRQKALYCINVAESVLGGRIDLGALSRMDDTTAANTLTQINGVGPWTADIYLLMALRRPDVWPCGDRALAITVRRVKGLNEDLSPSELYIVAEAWRPFRSVAARMLWQHYLSEKNQSGAEVR